jgi:phage terminase large subunit
MDREAELNEKFFEFFNANKNKRLLLLPGGSGSGKSHSVCQLLVMKALQEHHKKMLIIRKYGPQIRDLTFPFLKEKVLDDWGINYNENKTERKITINDSFITGRGLDDPEKIKGGEYELVWIEEATDLDHQDFLQLRNRLSRTRDDPQIIMSYNPIDENHWIIKQLEEKPTDEMAILHTTYHDAERWLAPKFIKDLENSINEDENFYRVYCLGQPGVLEGQIYKRFIFEDISIINGRLMNAPPDRYGLDLGFERPTAMVAIWMVGKRAYIHELIYKNHMTDDDLVREMGAKGVSKDVPIYSDHSLTTIETLQRAGYSVHEADKRNVIDGIRFCQRLEMVISTESVNVMKEIRGYSFRKDRKTDSFIDEPSKMNDHAMDAIRYGIYTEHLDVEEQDPYEEPAKDESSLSQLFRDRYGPDNDQHLPDLTGGWN